MRNVRGAWLDEIPLRRTFQLAERVVIAASTNVVSNYECRDLSAIVFRSLFFKGLPNALRLNLRVPSPVPGKHTTGLDTPAAAIRNRAFDILAREAAIMALIREEIASDYNAVRELNRIAFGGVAKQS